MSEFRKDILSSRWVVVTDDNPFGPDDYSSEQRAFSSAPCPFCEGNEQMTPPEIDAFRSKGSKPNAPGWQVRAVANKFPALKIEGELEKMGIGIYDMIKGVGAHEVIIETPHHDLNLSDLSKEDIVQVLRMYSRRVGDLRNDKRFKYALLFKNQGVAGGASLEHTHTQLIALPMIPKNAAEELQSARRYFEWKGHCVFCDLINQEKAEQVRILSESDSFIAFCPYVSRFPFEIHIYPKKHLTHFFLMEDQEYVDFARILKKTLTGSRKCLKDPSYNFIIVSAPFDRYDTSFCHWHIEIMPRLTKIAGFEWGTGFYIVRTPPELAVTYLKQSTA